MLCSDKACTLNIDQLSNYPLFHLLHPPNYTAFGPAIHDTRHQISQALSNQSESLLITSRFEMDLVRMMRTARHITGVLKLPYQPPVFIVVQAGTISKVREM